MTKLQFPKGFLWGASSASHQVEGNNQNDWSEWEKSHPRVADLEARGLLEEYKIENYISGKGPDHYNLFDSDYKIAHDLGHNATRISLEWSRIEPIENVFDEKEIEHYRDVVRSMRANGLEPFITLWHWPIPLWLRDKGGWESSEIVFYFTRYAEKITKALGKEVTFYLTLNEPEIYSTESYLQGVWPPQKKNPLAYLRVQRHMIKAHRAAYKVIKENDPTAQISMAFNLLSFEPVTILDKFLVKIFKWWRNDHLINQAEGTLDFIGFNYYFHERVHFGLRKNHNKIISDLNWQLHPEGIYLALKSLKRYNLPIYITENGLADATDSKRKWFIEKTLTAIHQAITEGVNVKGYLHWSLMDNFEWDKGYWPRFGLIEIDYKTLERKIRPSALYYKEICQNNSLSI